MSLIEKVIKITAQMRILFLGILCYLFSIQLKAQPCSLVDITYTQLISLPECSKEDGSIIITDVSGGTAPYSFKLDSAQNLFGTFLNLSIGVYNLTVTDARGCNGTTRIDLNYSNIENIIRPFNAFTPNGDDINDRWIIPGIESFQATEVRIFNRWGQLIYKNSDYTNTEGWDGKQNNSKLPAATYYYVISTINNCIEEYLKGTVTIVR